MDVALRCFFRRGILIIVEKCFFLGKRRVVFVGDLIEAEPWAPLDGRGDLFNGLRKQLDRWREPLNGLRK
jgi:hypothetical protein